MSLDKSYENYLNKLIIVKPVYGWGWTRLNAPEVRVPNEVNGVPRPFACQITEFLYYRDIPNSAVGQIIEENHIYNKLWTFIYLRVEGIFNFIDEIGNYNLQIGPQMQEIPAGKEWLEFTSGSPIVNGYAVVAESIKRIEQYDEQQNEKWEITRDGINDNS